MDPVAHKDKDKGQDTGQDKGQGQGPGQGAPPTDCSSHQREALLEEKAVGGMLILVRLRIAGHVHLIKQKKGMVKYFMESSRISQWYPHQFILLRVGTMNVNKSLSMIMDMKIFLLP